MFIASMTLVHEFTSPQTYTQSFVYYLLKYPNYTTKKITSPPNRKILATREHCPSRIKMIPKYIFKNIRHTLKYSFVSAVVEFLPADAIRSCSTLCFSSSEIYKKSRTMYACIMHESLWNKLWIQAFMTDTKTIWYQVDIHRNMCACSLHEYYYSFSLKIKSQIMFQLKWLIFKVHFFLSSNVNM